jgi:hypothetical protein
MPDHITVTIEASSTSLPPGTKLTLCSDEIVSFMSANDDGTGTVEITMVDGTMHFIKETLDDIMRMLE